MSSELTDLSRRDVLARSARLATLLGSLGLLPELAGAAWSGTAFEAKTVAEAVRALGLALPVESHEVQLSCPEIAENGAVVPVAVSAPAGGVRRLLILIDKNPAVLAAVFDVLSEVVEPGVSTRVKLAQSCRVHGVAQMADGRVLFASKEVKVTLGGCGG